MRLHITSVYFVDVSTGSPSSSRHNNIYNVCVFLYHVKRSGEWTERKEKTNLRSNKEKRNKKDQNIKRVSQNNFA